MDERKGVAILFLDACLVPLRPDDKRRRRGRFEEIYGVAYRVMRAMKREWQEAQRMAAEREKVVHTPETSS